MVFVTSSLVSRCNHPKIYGTSYLLYGFPIYIVYQRTTSIFPLNQQVSFRSRGLGIRRTPKGPFKGLIIIRMEPLENPPVVLSISTCTFSQKR